MFKDKIVCFDIETRGFVPVLQDSKDIHVIYIYERDSAKGHYFFDAYPDRTEPKVHLGESEKLASGTIEDGVKALLSAKCCIIQNGSGFDWHVLEKMFPELMEGFDYFGRTDDPNHPFKVMDTFNMSSLLNPERRPPQNAYAQGLGNVGAHSIAAHGIRIGMHKVENEDWTTLTAHMLDRVSVDVKIGVDWYDYLMVEWFEQIQTPSARNGMTIEDAYWVEHRFAFSAARMALRGFPLDMGFLGECVMKWDEELKGIEKDLQPHLPYKLGTVKAKYSNTQLKFLEENLSPQDLKELLDVGRSSSSATVWKLTIAPKKGLNPISSGVQKVYPEMVGFKEDYGHDWAKALVAGAFTPVTFTKVGIGSRELIKETLYSHGWLGVDFSDAELAHMEEYQRLITGKEKDKEAALAMGEMPYPWSGKINEASIRKWQIRSAYEHGFVPSGSGDADKEALAYSQSHKTVPEWAILIGRYYVVAHRLGTLANMKDLQHFKSKGEWPMKGGVPQCKGLFAKAVCQDTGLTGMQYYEKYGMIPDSGHWRIPAIAVTIGTNTFRCRHKNVVNIPSRGIYGKEMRKIFCCAPNTQIVGCDGSGLELRMLAHYMGSPEYTEIVLNGDIHSYHQEKAEIDTRDGAKTFIYMWLYGAFAKTIARFLGVSEEKAATIIASILRNMPDLEKLISGVQHVGSLRGFLVGLDGRRGRLRKSGGKYKAYTALNVVLQMAGSITMKWGHVLAEDLAVERGLIKDIKDFPMMAHQHDEAQIEELSCNIDEISYTIDKADWKSEEKRVHTDGYKVYSAPTIIQSSETELVIQRRYSPLGQAYADGITLAGEKLKLRCPTAGEYKVGSSWAETH